VRYRRRGQQFESQEKSFAQKFKYEAIKENIGKLVEYGGVGLGALAGTAAAKTGLPLSPTAITIVGAAVGGFAASTAKASVVSAVDHYLERRDRRQADQRADDKPVLTATPPGEVTRAPSREPPPVGELWRRATSTRNLAQAAGNNRAATGASSGIGSVIAAVGASISQLEGLEGELIRVAQQMKSSQERLTAVLRGGRQEAAPSRLLSAARNNIEDSAGLVHQAGQDVHTYLRTL
jgi:hypothetical protein